MQEHAIDDKFMLALTYQNIQLPYYLKGLTARFGFKSNSWLGEIYIIELYHNERFIYGFVESPYKFENEEKQIARAWKKLSCEIGLFKWEAIIKKSKRIKL